MENSEIRPVEIGNKVKIKFPSGAIRSFQIVSDSKLVSPEDGLISAESPLGQAIIGHGAEESVTYKVRNNNFCVKILEIQ